MRIPTAESELGLVEKYYSTNVYRWISTETTWGMNRHLAKQPGRLMTWADFKLEFPFRGYYAEIRSKQKLKNY